MNDELLESMDGMRDIVASMAGIKTLFIEAGFSQEISELMVLEILKKTTSS